MTNILESFYFVASNIKGLELCLRKQITKKLGKKKSDTINDCTVNARV